MCTNLDYFTRPLQAGIAMACIVHPPGVINGECSEGNSVGGGWRVEENQAFLGGRLLKEDLHLKIISHWRLTFEEYCQIETSYEDS